MILINLLPCSVWLWNFGYLYLHEIHPDPIPQTPTHKMTLQQASIWLVESLRCWLSLQKRPRLTSPWASMGCTRTSLIHGGHTLKPTWPKQSTANIPMPGPQDTLKSPMPIIWRVSVVFAERWGATVQHIRQVVSILWLIGMTCYLVHSKNILSTFKSLYMSCHESRHSKELFQKSVSKL